MSPDTLESRMAALKQQVDDLSGDVHAFAGAVAQQAVFSEQISNLREKLLEIRRDLDGLHDALRSFKDELSSREQAQVKERKSDRRWMIGTVIASTSVIIGALAIVASVMG